MSAVEFRRNRLGRWLAVSIAAGVLAVAGVSIAAAEENAAATAPAKAAVKAARPMRRIHLEAEKWRWTPNTIRVRRGTHVVLEVYSSDASRAFELKAYGLKVGVPEGDTVRVEFDADKVGSFPWRCSRPCGDGCAKLKGTLIVEE